jgi:hypothetical protein
MPVDCKERCGFEESLGTINSTDHNNAQTYLTHSMEEFIAKQYIVDCIYQVWYRVTFLFPENNALKGRHLKILEIIQSAIHELKNILKKIPSEVLQQMSVRLESLFIFSVRLFERIFDNSFNLLFFLRKSVLEQFDQSSFVYFSH